MKIIVIFLPFNLYKKGGNILSKNIKYRFLDIYNDFLVYVKCELKEQSYLPLQRNFNLHILPIFKDKSIKTLKKEDLMNWKLSIYKNNFSNSFNNTLFSNFNRFLKYCIDMDYIKVNYLKDIGNFKRKIEKRKENFYSLKEFNKFIKGFDAEDEIYKQFFIILFYTGLRPSEALALKFNDLKNDYIDVNKNLQRRGLRKVDTPKTASSYRFIFLDDNTINNLLNLKEMYMLEYSTDCVDDLFIFGGKKPLSTTTIDRRKHKVCQKLKMREITQHGFRHSHATLLITNRVPINVVSKRLGHSDISTTLDIYTHCDLEQEKRVSKKLNHLHKV